MLLICVICASWKIGVSQDSFLQSPPQQACHMVVENPFAAHSLLQVQHKPASKRAVPHAVHGQSRAKLLAVNATKGCPGGDQHRSGYDKSHPDKNIYGRELVPCGSNPGSSAEGGMCNYVGDKDDPGRHQVCVTKLPAHFSKKGGQGDWSEPETGREWCACIWAYANWVLNHDVKKLPVKCDAVTEKVLVSDYALSAWASCGQMSSQCDGYAKAIKTLCSHCKKQAPNDDAKHELAQKCQKMLDAAKTKL